MDRVKVIFKIAFLLVLCNAFQTTAQSDARFGIRLGLNESTFKNILPDPSNLNHFRLKASLHAGVFYRKKIASQSSLETGLYFSGKGAQYKYGMDDTQASIRLNYLTLPLHYQYHIGNLLLEVGPFLGYQLSVKVVAEEPNLVDTSFLWKKDIDYGLGAGIQYQLNRLAMGIRYERSFAYLSDVWLTDENGEPLRMEKYGSNSVFQFSIAYSIWDKD